MTEPKKPGEGTIQSVSALPPPQESDAEVLDKLAQTKEATSGAVGERPAWFKWEIDLDPTLLKELEEQYALAVKGYKSNYHPDTVSKEDYLANKAIGLLMDNFYIICFDDRWPIAKNLNDLLTGGAINLPDGSTITTYKDLRTLIRNSFITVGLDIETGKAFGIGAKKNTYILPVFFYLRKLGVPREMLIY
ncbi:MAG: hypothetical protein WC777_04020 [Candidatus Gracilibacteria bacterium]|jgi:hypothetical protein